MTTSHKSGCFVSMETFKNYSWLLLFARSSCSRKRAVIAPTCSGTWLSQMFLLLAERWWRAVAVWSWTVGTDPTGSPSFTTAIPSRQRFFSKMSSNPSRNMRSKYVRCVSTYKDAGGFECRVLLLLSGLHLKVVFLCSSDVWIPGYSVPGKPLHREPAATHGPSHDLHSGGRFGHKAFGHDDAHHLPLAWGLWFFCPDLPQGEKSSSLHQLLL